MTTPSFKLCYQIVPVFLAFTLTHGNPLSTTLHKAQDLSTNGRFSLFYTWKLKILPISFVSKNKNKNKLKIQIQLKYSLKS